MLENEEHKRFLQEFYKIWQTCCPTWTFQQIVDRLGLEIGLYKEDDEVLDYMRRYFKKRQRNNG